MAGHEFKLAAAPGPAHTAGPQAAEGNFAELDRVESQSYSQQWWL
jgi:hypothetical protein